MRAQRSPAWRLAGVPAEMCNRCSQWDVIAFLIYVCVRACLRAEVGDPDASQGERQRFLGVASVDAPVPARPWGPRDARKPSRGGRITANFSLLTFFVSVPLLFAAFRRTSAIKRERGFAKHS